MKMSISYQVKIQNAKKRGFYTSKTSLHTKMHTTYDQILTFGEYPYPETNGYVYTRQKLEPTEYVEFTSEDTKELISKLKKEEGKDIWLVGGAALADEFIKRGLIDEYVIAVIPYILGDGIKLFREGNPNIKFDLKCTDEGNGITILHYKKR